MVTSSARIAKILNKESAILGSSKKVFLAGLDQGGTLVLAAHMLHDLQVGGLLAMHTQAKAVVDWAKTDVEKKN